MMLWSIGMCHAVRQQKSVTFGLKLRFVSLSDSFYLHLRATFSDSKMEFSDIFLKEEEIEDYF